MSYNIKSASNLNFQYILCDLFEWMCSCVNYFLCILCKSDGSAENSTPLDYSIIIWELV